MAKKNLKYFVIILPVVVFMLCLLSCNKGNPGAFAGQYNGKIVHSELDSAGNVEQRDTVIASLASEKNYINFTDKVGWFSFTGEAKGNAVNVTQGTDRGTSNGVTNLLGDTLTISGTIAEPGGGKITIYFVGVKQ